MLSTSGVTEFCKGRDDANKTLNKQSRLTDPSRRYLKTFANICLSPVMSGVRCKVLCALSWKSEGAKCWKMSRVLHRMPISNRKYVVYSTFPLKIRRGCNLKPKIWMSTVFNEAANFCTRIGSLLFVDYFVHFAMHHPSFCLFMRKMLFALTLSRIMCH